MHRFVPKQETCQLLKEAGMPQEGGEFYWVEALSGKWLLTKYEFREPYWDKFPPVRAPLTDELLKILKSEYDRRRDILSVLSFVGMVHSCLQSDHPSESLAKIILELRKEGVRLW